MADADGHPLACFAAVADAGIKGHVVADGADLFQRGGTVTDQGGAFDGFTDYTVADAVSLGAGKHEFAVGDIDLAAAEAHGVDAVFEGGDDACGVIFSAQHIGVGHARHRDMGETFAAAIAGRGDAHQAGVLAILHVADKNAVFDEGVFGGGRAFVIKADRAATVWHGAVIQHGDTGGGDALTHQARKGGGFLAVEIAFEPVADGFVQQYTRPAGAEDHIHGACGGGDGVEVDKRDAKGFAGDRLPVLRFHQAGKAVAATAAGATGLAAAVRLHNHRN